APGHRVRGRDGECAPLANVIASQNFSPAPADGPTQEGIAERYERRYVLVVLAIAVPSRRKFIEMCFVAHCLQLRRHLAGVAWMGAVVAAAGRDQDRRIGLFWGRHVIGGEARGGSPIPRLFGVGGFGRRPRSAPQPWI